MRITLKDIGISGGSVLIRVIFQTMTNLSYKNALDFIKTHPTISFENVVDSRPKLNVEKSIPSIPVISNNKPLPIPLLDNSLQEPPSIDLKLFRNVKIYIPPENSTPIASQCNIKLMFVHLPDSYFRLSSIEAKELVKKQQAKREIQNTLMTREFR